MKTVSFELDYNTRDFRPTVEWMSRRYSEANEKLFGGALGKCDFEVFTTGRGSRGATNGWFKLTGGFSVTNGGGLIKHTPLGLSTINHDNFYLLAKPRIELNGNKRGSEWAFMVTLVHEMCHYYTYMNGTKPARGHGKEFHSIADKVTKLSGGQIEVTTRTTVDRSKHFVYDRIKNS
jgi:hypothetical protein